VPPLQTVHDATSRIYGVSRSERRLADVSAEGLEALARVETAAGIVVPAAVTAVEVFVDRDGAQAITPAEPDVADVVFAAPAVADGWTRDGIGRNLAVSVPAAAFATGGSYTITARLTLDAGGTLDVVWLVYVA